jgi:hypothetical protein
VSRRAILLLTTALMLSGAQQASAQTTQVEPAGPPQVGSDRADGRAGQDEHATTGMRQDQTPDQQAPSQSANDDSPRPNPPFRDETVGSGSAIDRAPRDIREPFDE